MEKRSGKSPENPLSSKSREDPSAEAHAAKNTVLSMNTLVCLLIGVNTIRFLDESAPNAATVFNNLVQAQPLFFQ